MGCGSEMEAAAGCSGPRRFTTACGVLSQRVRAEAAAGKTMAEAAAPATMLLMPGADVATPHAAPAPARAQLTLMYAGRVMVFDDVPADRAAVLMRATARRDVTAGLADVQVARNASLRRFMEKRRDRLAARAPYAASRPAPSPASKKGKEADAEVGCWLRLGIPGQCTH